MKKEKKRGRNEKSKGKVNKQQTVKNRQILNKDNMAVMQVIKMPVRFIRGNCDVLALIIIGCWSFRYLS